MRKQNNFRQGYYKPKNPDKYVGDPTKIRYMSSWELRVHQFYDTDKRIIRWSSEPIRISYIKPTDGKLHYYYPDYWVEYVNKKGKLIRELQEVKPLRQTKRSRKRNPRRKLYEDMVYAVNMAKFKAAERYVRERKWKFRILTEKDIFK